MPSKDKTLLIESKCPGAIVVPSDDPGKPTIIPAGRSQMAEPEWEAVQPRLRALSSQVSAVGQALG